MRPPSVGIVYVYHAKLRNGYIIISIYINLLLLVDEATFRRNRVRLSREITQWLHNNIYIYQPFTLIIIIIYITVYIMYIILTGRVDSFSMKMTFSIYKDRHIPSPISAEIHTQANYMRYSWAEVAKSVTSANINTK
nr:MAG TPA: hypothetical protein [Caudoviricetes sp.]